MGGQRHLPTVAKLLLMSVAMFGFGFLMVPLYDLICDITGLNGKTGQIGAAEAAAIYEPDYSREIRVEFSGTVNEQGQWLFTPETRSMVVHPGKAYTTSYYAENTSGAAAVAQAVPSVAPSEASLYFQKTECFCFTEQPFDEGEGKQMPVTFVIDPRIPPSVDVVTLAYTFFEKPG